MEYDEKSGRPSYQFLQGIPGDSLAIQTAKRIGIPKKIIERAIELLSPETRARLSSLEEIDKLKSDIGFLREHLKKETQKAHFEKERFQQLSEKLQKDKEDILARLQRETTKKIDELISQTKVDQTFKKHMTLQEIKHQLPEIVKSRTGVAPVSNLASAADFSKRFPPGSKVFVATLNQDAVVQSLPNSKGEVMVLSGSLRLSLPWQDLKPPDKAGNPTARILRQSASFAVALDQSEKTVDLRGMTAEEALGELEIQLDRAATQSDDRIKIVHGHGTETLKKAVRAYLSRSVYVKKWKAGSPDQGGDGITWAEIGET